MLTTYNAANYLLRKKNDRDRMALEMIGGFSLLAFVMAVMLLWLCILGEVH